MNSIRKLEILDCTIRDGGYVNNWDFQGGMVKDVFHRLSMAGVDYVELGFRDHHPGSSAWRNCSDELMSEMKNNHHNAKISLMVDYGKATEADFLPRDRSAVDLVRVAVNRNKISGALELLARLKDLGYLTSLQLMGYGQYSERERESLLGSLKGYSIDYVYVADSYGSLFPHQIHELISPLVALEQFKIGFHPHNNLGLAFANTLEAIKSGAVIVDSTLYGMGRGAGNLQTETLLAFLQDLNEEKYNVIHALYLVDMYMLQMLNKHHWGYQLPYMLSGICQCHPSYPKEIIESRRYTIDDVWQILRVIKKRNPIGFDKNMLGELLTCGEFGRTSEASAMPPEGQTENSGCSLTPPEYINRHSGRPFLVLANGSSLKTYRDDIQSFIKRFKPIVLGANFLKDIITPDYHAFTSRRRFVQYIQTVSSESKLLLGCNLEEDFVKEYTHRTHERIQFYDSNDFPLSVNNGIIMNNCASVSMLLIAVAHVMGARSIYIAGMDGFLRTNSNGRFYFYDEDESHSEEFNLLRHKHGERTLEGLNRYLQENGAEGLKIITPTAYEKYYVGLRNFI